MLYQETTQLFFIASRYSNSFTAKEGRADWPGNIMELTHATDSTFDSEVLDSDRPVLVDFWADWCQPCKMVEPHLKAIAEEMPDKIRVVKVNLDDSPGVAGRFGVLSIPTMVLFNDGVEKTRLVGARPKEAIVSEIEQYL